MKYFLLLFALITIHPSNAQNIQWASKLIDFSSEYTPKKYGAAQVLGAPSCTQYGESLVAWAPQKGQAGKEFVTVGYNNLMHVQQIVIGENLNPGAISKIILYDEFGKDHEVYESKYPDPDKSGIYGLTSIKITPTSYRVNKLKLILNTNAIYGMQQIDCIGIASDNTTYVPQIKCLQYTENIPDPENLGPAINSEYDDMLPIISPDGQTLYFARKWAYGNTGTEHRDDIYVANRLPNNSFTKAENIGEPLNTSIHNFVCFVSADNNTLYLANRYKGGGDLNGVSYSVRQKDNTWGKPKSLPIKNMYNYSEFACYHLSLDEHTLLMAIEREDTYGDMDLYVSFKYADGSWSEPMNLGNKINTAGAEASVFLAADGKTLYFSTNGRAGYGNFDMYMSKRLDNSWKNWSEPLNLGAKINTPAMDIYYTIPASGEYAYFSSSNSYFGKNDIFRIRLPKEARPEPVNLTNFIANAPLKKDITPPNTTLDEKLATLKNQQTTNNKPVTNTTSNYQQTAIVPVQNKPAVTSSPVDLEKKIDDLKQQQQINKPKTQTIIPATTNTQPKTTYKTEYTEPTPLKAPDAPKPDYSLKAFENIPKTENNDPAKKTFDNLAAQQKNTDIKTAPVVTEKTAPVSYQEITVPASTVDQPAQQTSLKTQPVSNDPLQDKLDALKKQQQTFKPNTPDQQPISNSPYSQYTQPKEYPNPAPDYSNRIDPQADALQQKLYNEQPQYNQQEGIKLPPQDPYEKQWNQPALKPKQTDQFTQDYADMEDKINALKQQQQQQKFNGDAPKASKIKADTSNPAIKYIPPTPAPAQTDITSTNPEILKYQDKLKKIQDQLAAINQPVVGTKTNPEPATTISTESKPADLPSANIISAEDKTTVTKTEPLIVHKAPDTDSLEKQQKQLETLQEQQQITNDKLDNTLSSLNDSKKDLENDINNLSAERDKMNADKNKLSNENSQLTEEKEKLEADKKKMDELLTQMQAERDKLSQEKIKMENEKAKMDALKKQQEKEIFALKSSIDSLKKVQTQAADEAAKLPRYDLFNVPIEVGAVAVMSNIYFVADAAFIQTKSYPELDKLVAFMKQNNTLKVEIGGHTNGLCDDVFCNKLSNDRAKSVLDYLVGKGIDIKKLSYKGYGKQLLVAKPGDAINQRVEIKILSLQ